MEREIYSALLDWKSSQWRKPLILKGARQVGKTYLLQRFAEREYENYVYINFEDDPSLDELFAGRFDRDKLLDYFSIYGKVKVTAHPLCAKKAKTP